MSAAPEIKVTKNAGAQRYEAWAGNEIAGFASYHVVGELVEIPHTEVRDAFAGRGVGSRIVRFALDDVRSGGRRVVPLCPFVKAWIDRHPDYAQLVYRASSRAHRTNPDLD